MVKFAGDEGVLAGRTALVTGAGAGLGREMSIALSKVGATVYAADIDHAGARDTVSRLPRRQGAAAFRVDVSDPDSVTSLATEVDVRGGGLNVLVNNAGITQPSLKTHDMPIEDWDRVIAVNLTGTFLCSRALLPSMLATGSGSIINISSIIGLRGLDPQIMAQSAYAASKAGVAGLTRQMAGEYGGDGIRVNAVAPGWHSGTMLGRRVGSYATDQERIELEGRLIPRTPLGRRGQPQELNGLIVYLASDASSFMTGQVIAHDGGWTAW